MKNISKPALLSLTFPLPPLDVQHTLVAALEAGRSEASRLRSKAKDTRAKAWRAFEKSVYAADPLETEAPLSSPKAAMTEADA
jgi:type I restriction enzyme S subunit